MVFGDDVFGLGGVLRDARISGFDGAESNGDESDSAGLLSAESGAEAVDAKRSVFACFGATCLALLMADEVSPIFVFGVSAVVVSVFGKSAFGESAVGMVSTATSFWLKIL